MASVASELAVQSTVASHIKKPAPRAQRTAYKETTGFQDGIVICQLTAYKETKDRLSTPSGPLMKKLAGRWDSGLATNRSLIVASARKTSQAAAN